MKYFLFNIMLLLNFTYWVISVHLLELLNMGLLVNAVIFGLKSCLTTIPVLGDGWLIFDSVYSLNNNGCFDFRWAIIFVVFRFFPAFPLDIPSIQVWHTALVLSLCDNAKYFQIWLRLLGVDMVYPWHQVPNCRFKLQNILAVGLIMLVNLE